MIEIPLTKNHVAIIDDEDMPAVSGMRWEVARSKNVWYAIHRNRSHRSVSKMIFMHRLLMGAKPFEIVDHRDGDGLNNRRQNLRICSNQQNSFNKRLSRNNTSGFKGVSFHKRHNLYQASIRINGRSIFLGTFKTAMEASHAYDDGAIKYFGEFALTNAEIINRGIRL